MELANSVGAMAETKSRSLSGPMSKKRYLEFYTIRGTTKVVRLGESVLMRPSGNKKAPNVARVQRFVADAVGNVRVIVRWFYRPEETSAGRLLFHGMKELLLSDHVDTRSADTIEDKCIVHTYKNYANLEDVRPEDYFCRCEYCKCEMPSNPDILMVQCEDCNEWYHPGCIAMPFEQATKQENYKCEDCESVDDS